ncbi:hypothetical protein Bca101_056852 [Brassica carinata]
MFSRDEEILSDARTNDDMVGLKELTIIPRIREDENEKSDEVGTERVVVVTPAEAPVEAPVVHLEWDDGIDMALHQEFETKHEGSDSEGSGSEGSGDEGGDNEGNDE